MSQVLPWSGFCLVSRIFSAAFNFRSPSTSLDYGVLQVSVLGALLLLYLLPSFFSQRLKTLFVSFKPQDVSERQILHRCVDSVKGWSADSSSQIEEEKTTFRM